MRGYLQRLQREWNDACSDGQHTAELSFHPCLDELFRKLANELCGGRNTCVVFEPRNQARMGRPDWRIHDRDTFGVYGYIEAKGLSAEPFDTTPYESQFHRYLSLGHRLVITDGIDFVYVFEQGHDPQCVSLVDKRHLESRDWSELPVNPDFELIMRGLFAEPLPRFCDEGSLVEQVALRTRYFADALGRIAGISLDEAVDDSEKDAIILLGDLQSLVFGHDDCRMRSPKVFSDFVAQIVMFTLLYAHRMTCSETDSANDKHTKIREFLLYGGERGFALQPFFTVMDRIGSYGDENFIMTWADECVRFLSYVHMTDEQRYRPDYHKLFELFLSKFDPKSRFDYGAFYTPCDLAACVVRLADAIADASFGGVSIFDEGSVLIDPCCGTGSFLEQLWERGVGRSGYALCGIEILPAPYMLATYRMAMLDKSSKEAVPRSTVLLANALSDQAFEGTADMGTVEGMELLRVNEVSSKPLKLVIGNPPSSDSFRGGQLEGFDTINRLMDDFRPPKAARHGRQNIQKQVNNPFLQFLRWACFELESNPGCSMLAYVVPGSFLEADSYRYARKYLADHFDSLWILSIDADARAGIRSDSVFKTRQGRAVVVAVRNFKGVACSRTYQYCDLSHMSREEKGEWFGRETADLLDSFIRHTIDPTDYAFKPALPFDEKLYARYWPVSDDAARDAVFKSHCSGIKLAPSSLFTHVKRSLLKRRSREVSFENVDKAVEWFGAQDKPPSDEAVRAFSDALRALGSKENAEAVIDQHTFEYAFRPFVTMKCFLWEDLLKKFSRVGGGGTRRRPEVMAAFSKTGTMGFALSHSPKDQKNKLGQFASFCWYRPDNDLCRRGNAFIYLNRYPEGRRGKGKLVCNVNERLCLKLSALLDVDGDTAARDMVFYSYAILCSQVYLDKFEGALFTVNRARMRPRIPVSGDAAIFQAIVNLGHRIADLERVDYRPQNIVGYDYGALPEQVPSGFKLHWSHGLQPFDEKEETVTLLGIDGRRIIVPCPVEVQHVVIAGYEVIKNVWMKFNSYEFTHCQFSRSDMVSFLDLLNKLTEYLELVKEIDDVVRHVLNDEAALILPNQ